MIKSHEMITESYNICELITKLIHEANINETVAWFCHWTYDNKMEEAQKNGQLEASYSYDFRGERIHKATVSEETAFLIDNNNQTGYSQTLRETDGSNAEKVAYTFGDDLISQKREEVSYLHYDGLGSTRALTSMAAEATDTFSYLAFGSLLNRTGSTSLSHLFTGEAYDFNLGFYYLRARLYNPQTGRFASLDPFSGINSDPQSLHKYLYVNNNTINSIDPSGLIDWSLAAKAVALTIIMILKSIAIATLSNFMIGFLNRKKAFCPCGNWYTLGFGEEPKEYMKMSIAAERAVGSFTACCFDKVNGKSRYCIIKLECQTVHGEIKVQSTAAFYVRVFASIYSKEDWSRPDLKVGIGAKGMASVDGNIGTDVGITVRPSASIGAPGYIESCEKRLVKCGECNPRHRSCPCGIKGPDYAEFNYRVQGQKNAAWKDIIFLLRGGR